MVEVREPGRLTDGEMRTLYEILVEIANEIMGELGSGFNESVYQSAFAYELRRRGIWFQREPHIEVIYKGIPLALDRPDFIIRPCEGDLLTITKPYILELKAVKRLNDSHKIQLRNYINSVAHSSDLTLRSCIAGILINFADSGSVEHIMLVKEVEHEG